MYLGILNFRHSWLDPKELLLTVSGISRDIHNTVFTCEVVNMFPNGIIAKNRTDFIINAEELSKSLKVQVSYIV